MRDKEVYEFLRQCSGWLDELPAERADEVVSIVLGWSWAWLRLRGAHRDCLVVELERWVADAKKEKP